MRLQLSSKTRPAGQELAKSFGGRGSWLFFLILLVQAFLSTVDWPDASILVHGCPENNVTHSHTGNSQFKVAK